MQANQQQQHESWNVTIRARARRKFNFTVKARNISTTRKFQRFSVLLRLYSFIFRLKLESKPAAVLIPRQTLKSKFLKIVKKIRICSWKTKTSAPKKDVKVLANPSKKLAFERTGKISPFWLVLMVACVAAAVYCVIFHLGKYMKYESAYISQYVIEAFKYAGSIANEILDKWYEL